VIGEQITLEHYLMLAAWLVGPAAVFALHSRRGRLAGVLLYSYIFGFFMAHWPGALVHFSPWGQFIDSTDTLSGFELSTVALFCLLFGAVLVPTPPQARVAVSGRISRSPEMSLSLQYRSASVLLVIGFISWFLPFTPAAQLPSAAAIFSAGKQAALLAVCLFSWLAWQEHNYKRFYLWLSLALILPFITVATQGFIGYGIAMLGTVLLFMAMFFRPRWLIVAGLVVGIYGGLSLWVAYAFTRNEIRATVWGDQDMTARVTVMSKIFDIIVPFDLSNQRDLDVVDARLNQNSLVGTAMRVTPAYVPYENGETIYAAIFAIIPRALWPDKPATGGSGDYVSRHTMIDFAAGTSVGMGQVLEFYINFGLPAVVIGFVLLGMLLRSIDIGFVNGIETGDFARAQFYFLVGAGALQAGGSLTEMAAAMSGGAVLALVINRYFRYMSMRRAMGRLRRAEGRGGRL